MPKTDLLPCPFCGKVEALRMERIPFVYNLVCAVANGGCGASTGWNHATPEEAVKSWNTRASDWISCSERMPDEPGIHVMVTDGVHIMESWYEIIDGEMLWVDNYTMYVNINFGEVTHWKPIPELPKEVQHDIS